MIRSELKRPALAMLALALWLGGADVSWAGPSTSRAQFVALLANTQNQTISDRLHRRQTQLAVQSQRLEVHQQVVTFKIAHPPTPPILLQLQRQDAQLQRQSARIMHRLERINSLISTTTNPGRLSSLDRLRQSLTRTETTIGQRILAVQRLERQAATPSAPGGF